MKLISQKELYKKKAKLIKIKYAYSAKNVSVKTYAVKIKDRK